MPAEWEPHEATWLSWPHNEDTWPGCLAEVERAFSEMVRVLAEHERVHINVLNADHAALVRRRLQDQVPPERVRLHCCPTDDAWIRDYGAIFLCGTDGRRRLAVDFDYNAWGGKYPPYELDRRVAGFMAEVAGQPVSSVPLVLEGGSIDVNGDGCLLTTEQCLLHANRNPRRSRGEIEAVLTETIGARRMIWLGEGIAGDDTDGHIDQLARFVSADTVVAAVERDRADPNFAALRANRDRLEQAELPDGRRLRVVELPMPAPLFHRRQRLPASYANFYVANGVVLLPVFGCRQDAAAAELLRGCFPDRSVVPIDCRGVIAGLGALHCLTQQQPAC